jgi:hypothetical protein
MAPHRKLRSTLTAVVTAVLTAGLAGATMPAAEAGTVTASAGPATASRRPSTPTDLAIFSQRPTDVVVIWTYAADYTASTRFDVFLNGRFVARESSPGTYLEGLTPDTAYSLRVQAIDARGRRSALSAPLTFRTLPLEPLQPPTNLRVRALTPTSVDFIWDMSEGGYGIVNYWVFLDGVYRGATIYGGLAAYVSGLAPGSTHTITLQAFDQDGNRSAISAPLIVTTPRA